MLNGVPVWEFEYGGFLRGNLLEKKVPSRLVALEPYQSGRIPVVFVHGTASSPVRWAEMLNDLRGDPRIRDHFQFWFFVTKRAIRFPTPRCCCAMRCRTRLPPWTRPGRDPSLHEMVVIGHSQGGLLTKMAAVDSGDRFWNAAFKKPPEELDVSPESREMLKRALFIKPVPSVKRLIFIATPHGGSYVAGNRISHYIASLVRLPGNILRATSEIGKLDSETTALAGQAGFGSIYGMTPGSLLVTDAGAHPHRRRGQGPLDHRRARRRSRSRPAMTASSNTGARISRASSPSMSFAPGIRRKADPHTIEEVRRILLLHWAESCTKSRNCGPAPARPPLMASKSR